MRWLVIIFVVFLALSQARASSATALASASVYIKKVLNPQDIRFLDISNIPEDYRKEVLQVLTFQLNSLSTEPDFAVPKVVTAELLSINLLDYDSDDKRFRSTWEKLKDIEPYMHEGVTEVWPGGFDKRFGREYKTGKYTFRRAIPPYKGSQQDLDDLIHYTHSQVPVIRADFLFVQAARQLSLSNEQTGCGYYDFLGIKDRKDFEKLVAFDEKKSLEIKREIRAAVKDSGVATNPRQILRLVSLTGGYWVTLDTNNPKGRGNAIENPLRGEMVHQAEEIYGFLPNGLFAFMLSDAGGKRQDTAPDFIGPDDSPLRGSSHDARIHVSLSCIRCHLENGLRPVEDWHRKNLRIPLAFQTNEYKKLLEFKRNYFSNLSNAIELDRRSYADSLKSCNGMTSVENAKAFSKFWSYYVDEEVGTEIAAREYGLKEEEFVKYLKNYASRTGQLNLTLSGLIQDPQDKIKRVTWEELQPKIREILK